VKVTTALLCDFAQVRDRLLFVASGGITRVWRTQFPAPLGVHLALILELDQVELEGPHELQVIVMGQDGARLAELRGGFQANAGEAELGEMVQIPMAFDLRPVGVPGPGSYDVKIYIDGHHQHDLTLWCRQPPSG
jgi:hypothetical protein